MTRARGTARTVAALGSGLLLLAACAPPWNDVARAGGPGSEDADGVAFLPGEDVVVAGAFTGTTDLGGIRLTSAGGDDIFAARYGATGEVRWARRFGSGGADHVYDAAADSRGGSFLSGTFAGSVAFGGTTLTSAGGEGPYGDAVVAKLDAGGNVVWAKRMGGTGPDGGNEIATDSADDVVLVADSTGPFEVDGSRFESAGRDSYLIKLGPGGGVRWVRQLGGPGEVRGRGVGTAPDGSVLVTGQFSGTLTIGGQVLRSAGSSDVYLARFRADGQLLWARSFGAGTADIAKGVAADDAGNVYFSGSFSGTVSLDGKVLHAPEGTVGLFVARTDPAGRVQWATRLGGDGDNLGVELDVTGGGTSYVGGRVGTVGYFASVSPLGAVEWEKRPSGGFTAFDEVAVSPTDTNVAALGLLAGSAEFDGETLTSAGRTDLVVARLERREP